MFCFWFLFVLTWPPTGYKACSTWLGNWGRKRTKQWLRTLWIFALRKEKRLRHLAATTDAEKRSSQSQKGFDEQQTAPTCNLSLRRAKSMMKQSKKQTFREKRGHETTRTLKHTFLKCSDDFSRSLFQVPHEPGRIMISISGFFRRFPSHNSIPSHVSSFCN